MISSIAQPYKISFCTTCMNRLHHLKETLPANFANNSTYVNLEFILLNYNSKDDIDTWIEKEWMTEIESGRLKYLKTLEPLYFKYSHAKNMVAKFATGDIICNIDADNFTGPGFAEYINEQFNNKDNIFLIGGKEGFWDTKGRVCLWKSDFLKLNGYDERILDWGYEDIDFYYRVNNYLGRTEVKIEEDKYLQTIKHDEIEKMQNGVYHSEIEFGLVLETKNAIMAYILKKENRFEHLTIDSALMNTFIDGPIIKTEDIHQGEWFINGSSIELIDGESGRSQKIYTTDGGQSYSTTAGIYKRIPKSTTCHYYSLLKGRLIFQQNINFKKELNNDGFGDGLVFEPVTYSKEL